VSLNPTIARCITALRERGYDIRSERHGDGWRYVLAGKCTSGNDRAYRTLRNVRIWVITEADRSSGTILLPSEY
jgi:hypothetical protein